jgi:NADPH:quinone reductase-like Zn-dependent oxidoreductase
MTSPESAVTGRRVQFDRYGPADVLQVVEVPRPRAGAGEVIVRVVAAGLNPGEIAIRNGALDAIFPAAFPSGQGSDVAGRVVETGPGVTGLSAGDEVLGWSDERSAQADDVVSDPRHLTACTAAAPACITARAVPNRGFCAGLPRAETGVPDRAPQGESSPGGVYRTLLSGHGLPSARFPWRVQQVRHGAEPAGRA